MTSMRRFSAVPFRMLGLILLLALLGGCAARPGPLQYGSAESVGMDSVALDRAADLYRKAFENDGHRGAVLLISRRGTIVLHEAIGWQDAESEVPMDRDALFRMASNTKAVIGLAALILEEEGLLRMDDRVADWIPAFDTEGFADITIHHLATHTSGLPRGPIFFQPMRDDTHLQREAVLYAQRLQLRGTPGSRYVYSNVGYNVLGAVIEVAAGQPLEQVLRSRIYKPLGMHDSCNHESTADRSRMCKVYRLNEEHVWVRRWSPDDGPDFPIVRASGGMISSARDWAILLQTFLDGGRNGRVRVVSTEAVARATSPLVDAGAAGYGYGWRVNHDGVYNHGGSDGTFVWVDPANELFGIILTQSQGGNRPRGEYIRRVTQAIVDK